jgi:ubiquinone/menaquinone biosynthesis C-methylase UbiE
MTTSFPLSRVAFFGRSFFEYKKMFGLDIDSLRGAQVLDCPSGPSSFATEASKHGIEVTAVDPLFNHTFTALSTVAVTAFRQMFSTIREHSHLVTTEKTFTSIAEAEDDRRKALTLFLEDYYTGLANRRYICASLPTLPFKDKSFDLVLNGYLLFIYTDHFDYAFHLAACLEMCRVSRKEVRIHTIVDRSGEISPFLEPLMSDLNNSGIETKIIDLDYEFFRGATQTLILRP